MPMGRLTSNYTINKWELKAIVELERQGYEVHRKGWPDLIAVKDTEVRLIEVKPPRAKGMKPHQVRIAEIIKLKGLEAEVWRGGEEGKDSKIWRTPGA